VANEAIGAGADNKAIVSDKAKANVACDATKATRAKDSDFTNKAIVTNVVNGSNTNEDAIDKVIVTDKAYQTDEASVANKVFAHI
jgi:hypothetical protein